jgi:hypothetical protein
MANTGAKYPTVESSFSSDPHIDEDWEVINNLDDVGSNYDELTQGTYDNGDQTYLLKVSGFDFSGIPEDVISIDGVVVQINGYYTVSSSDFDYMKLLDTSGNPVGNDVLTPGSVSLQGAPTTHIFGTSTELWGNSLTRTWVQNSNFGVCFGLIATGNNANIYLDWLTMTIYYSVPSIAPTSKVWGGTRRKGMLSGIKMYKKLVLGR